MISKGPCWFPKAEMAIKSTHIDMMSGKYNIFLFIIFSLPHNHKQ